MINSQMCLTTLTESLVKDKMVERPMSAAEVMTEVEPILQSMYEVGKKHKLHGQYRLKAPPKPEAIAAAAVAEDEDEEEEEPAAKRYKTRAIAAVAEEEEEAQRPKTRSAVNITMHNYFSKV